MAFVRTAVGPRSDRPECGWHVQELGATRTPFYASLMSTLGASLAEAGRFPEAMLTFRKASRLRKA